MGGVTPDNPLIHGAIPWYEGVGVLILGVENDDGHLVGDTYRLRAWVP